MVSGRGGMGSHKHGISGKAPKSPNLRHKLQMDAELNDRKRKPSNCKNQSVQELFNG